MFKRPTPNSSSVRRLSAGPRPRLHIGLCWLSCLSLAVSIASGPLRLEAQVPEVIPDPDPELERKSFIVADGFEVNLFAADPQIAKPIQMNFDDQGRLWIASSQVYPQIQPGQAASDKILVLSDEDRDGRAERVEVFADGLLIPTGVLPGDGGAYVAHSTELLHLQDRDGDGRADSREVALSGFGTEDTHHLLHTLRWGHDGALYMNQSIYIHSHIETPYGVRRLNGGGIWRFRPDNLKLDILCRGFVNPWGHHFDHWGQSFATDGAYGEGINYVFPGAVYVTAPGAKRRVEGLNPGSPKHCGLEIVSGEHLPPHWQGNMLTNDFRAHRVCRFVVEESADGGWESRQEVELIKTTHASFRPIDVKMGPDGAIYIADWFNPIIQHGEVDFRDPRRDHVHGRIWRVTARQRALTPRFDYPQLSDDQLLELLARSEEWVRLHAKRTLAKRPTAADSIVRWLSRLDANGGDGAIGADKWVSNEHQRLEALWLFQMLDQPAPELLERLLNSRDHRVRAAAVRVATLWRDRIPQTETQLKAAVTDPHARVRLEAVRGLAESVQTDAAAAALLALDQPRNRFLEFALWQTVRDLATVWTPAIKAKTEDFDGNFQHLAFALQAVESPEVTEPLLELIQSGRVPREERAAALHLVAEIGGPEEIGQVLELLAELPDSLGRAPALEGLVELCRRRQIRVKGTEPLWRRLFDAPSPAVRAAAVRAAGWFRSNDLKPQIVAWAQADDAPPTLRMAACEALADYAGPAQKKILSELASGDDSPEVRAAAVTALSRVDGPAAARAAVAAMSGESPPDPALLVGALMTRKQGPEQLAAALSNAALPAEAAKALLRAVRASANATPALVAAVRAAGQLESSKWTAEPQLIQSLASEALRDGDAGRGEQVYRRKALQCGKCHAIAGAGGVVGPDLLSIGASAPVDYLVQSLLAPNEKVKENYHALVVRTTEGQVVTGIPVRKDDRQWVLRDADDREIVLQADAIEDSKPARSLMPDGTVDDLTRGDLVDLVRFLSELGKVGDFAAPSNQAVRTWRVLRPTPEAYQKIRRSSYDAAAADDPVFQFEPAYSSVSGDLPLQDLPGFVAATYVTKQPSAPTVFLRCRLKVEAAGVARIRWNDTVGLQVWVRGKPTPVRPTMDLEAPTGLVELTVAVNQELRQPPLRIELLREGTTAQATWVSGK